MRTKVLAFVVGATFLAGCGWLVRAAGPERKFAQGLACLRTNRLEEASYCLASIDHRSGYESEASLLRGWLRLQAHRPNEPEDYMATWADFTDALELGQYRALTLALMGRLLYQGGRFANALNMLNSALQEDPDEIEAHRWLGSALYDVGAVAPALEHLKRVADQEATNGRICRLLALIYREAADFRDAATAYEQSLARDPDQPDANQMRVDLARCWIALQDYNAALGALNDCQDTPDVFALRGLCYVSENNPKRAKDCVARALQGDPENAAALSCLAKIDPAAAVDRLSRAVERKPDDYQLRERLVETYRSLGEEERVAEHEQSLQAMRARRVELDQLLRQANENLFDPALRYRIGDLAESLGLPQLADDWRKAARLLDTPPEDTAPLPSVTPPLGSRR